MSKSTQPALQLDLQRSANNCENIILQENSQPAPPYEGMTWPKNAAIFSGKPILYPRHTDRASALRIDHAPKLPRFHSSPHLNAYTQLQLDPFVLTAPCTAVAVHASRPF